MLKACLVLRMEKIVGINIQSTDTETTTLMIYQMFRHYKSSRVSKINIDGDVVHFHKDPPPPPSNYLPEFRDFLSNMCFVKSESEEMSIFRLFLSCLPNTGFLLWSQIKIYKYLRLPLYKIVWIFYDFNIWFEFFYRLYNIW